MKLTEDMKKTIVLSILLCTVWLSSPSVYGRSSMSPWQTGNNFSELIYGSTTPVSLQSILGESPDDIIRSEGMYPVVENHYYYEKNGNGSATIFVFENYYLVGMHYMSPNRQMIDLTYFLINNGDRMLNAPAGYSLYYPNFPFFEPFGY